MPFLTNLDYRKIDEHKWLTLAPLVYEAEDGTVYTVPANFETDGPSIPRAFYVTTPPVGDYDKAGILHDFLYSVNTPVGKTKADSLFREAMKSCGVGLYTRTKMFLAVKMFGRAAYKGSR